MMKRMFGLAIGTGLLVSIAAGPALGAAPTTQRRDAFVEIWCQTAGGPALWRRVDLRTLDPGNSEIAVARFNANNPYGESCQVGPFE